MVHLDGFAGILQVDGYSGYRPLAARNSVSLAFCWSHVRRRFYELAASGPAPIASEALERIAELYKIEDEIRGRTHEDRRVARQGKSRSITDSLAPWQYPYWVWQKTSKNRYPTFSTAKVGSGIWHPATAVTQDATATSTTIEQRCYSRCRGCWAERFLRWPKMRPADGRLRPCPKARIQEAARPQTGERPRGDPILMSGSVNDRDVENARGQRRISVIEDQSAECVIGRKHDHQRLRLAL